MQKYRRLLRIIAVARPGKGLLTIIAILSVLGTLSSLLFPLLTKQLIDTLSSTQSLPGQILILLIILMIAGAVVSGVNHYLIGKIGNRMLVNLRSKTFTKAVSLPVSYYDNNSSSEPASRIINDTEIINDMMTSQLEPVISGSLTMVASLVILWLLDWQLTAIVFATLAAAFIIILPIAYKLIHLSTVLQEKEAHFLTFITERLANIRLIKACTAEQSSVAAGHQTLEELYQVRQSEVKINAFIGPIMTIAMIATLVIILVFGAVRVNQGLISMGTLIAFLLYVFNIIIPMAQLIAFKAALNKATGAAQRVHELLQEQDEQTVGGSQPIAVVDADITFNNLQFEYETGNPVLKNFNLHISANQTVAFVGESGAGKSTIFSLLLRYYEPTQGDILIGDQPLNSFSLRDWRKQIGYIAQDAPLLSGSILENLLLGLDKQPDERQIAEVLKLAQLDKFISGLTDGLDTLVGERGTKLSGGQKQRVAIARAMLSDSPILLCDEATSSLDAITEYKIQQAMQQLKANRTTLIAAHRLSTVLSANKIILLKDGQIIGEGTHQELMKSQPYYQELVEHQLRPFNEMASC